MIDLHNFEQYSRAALKINTKVHGLRPFVLRKYQLRYLQHLKEDFPDRIIRSVSLKPRQAGWSTLIAGINTHKMATQFNERGIMLADKFARTNEVHGIYSTFVNNIPLPIRPMIDKNNGDEILFDNPNKDQRTVKQGLGSGFKSETAQDPNAGRSGTRKWAHLTEHAFYPHALEIDEGVQNSIPLAPGTRIFKESTANGMAGDGEAFYVLWEAAQRRETIYKPFFVAWYEIDDYQLQVPPGFILNATEADLVRRCPQITHANLSWRRLKISEYSKTSDSALTPEERFKQDFPSYPEEAFLSTGRPVFDMDKLKNLINEYRSDPPQVRAVKFTKPYLSMYPKFLTVLEIPKDGSRYFIGADVAEGIEGGDASHAKILDQNLNEVAFFHGHLDPDHFGKVLVELAKIYRNALIVPEMNNMGHTTLQAIKEEDYLRVYMREVTDEIEDHKETSKMGWRTTSATKQKMLNGLIAAFRDDEINIRDVDTLREMLRVTRGDTGDVELNGKDRVVATCLALIGATQVYEPAKVFDPYKKHKVIFETKDLFREKMLKGER